MTPDAPSLWISEAEVTSLLDVGTAMAALEQGLQLEARGEATNMTKTHVAWAGGNLHAIGASFAGTGLPVPLAGGTVPSPGGTPGTGVAGTKTWAYTPKGSTPLLILFDRASGALLAVIEAFALGQLRTASASGVATRRLARPGACTFAIIGTGEQALPQAAAVAAVRPLEAIRVFGRDPGRKAAFARRVEEELGIPPTGADSVAQAVDGADIITLVTRATEPFLRSAMVAPGAHVNAVGAITPERAEFEPEILDRCDPIVADSVVQVQRLSREFIDYFERKSKPWTTVTSLCALIAGSQQRPQTSDLTLFKAMGMGISDLSLGIQCYRQAVEQGLGRSIPPPQRVRIRLRPAKTIPGGVRQ
jgi:ornithine cyclodeaminase